MKYIYKITISITILTILLLVSPSSTQAQSIVDLTVSPPISYLHTPPGTNREHVIILENSGDKAVTVTPSIVDFSSDGKSGKAILSNELSFPYISFGDTEVSELTIPAQAKAQLTLHIDVPSDATEREYPLTVLFFSNQQSNIISGTHSQVQAAIGSNLVVLVAKENKLERITRVLDFGSPIVVDSFSKLALKPVIKNESFATTSVSGTIKIVDWKKKTLAEYEIYPDNILGTSSREVRAQRPGVSDNSPETGSFAYKPKFLIGPYQVVITLDNEQVNTSYTEVHVFYALPISIISIITIGVLISIIYSRKIRTKNDL